MVRTPPRAGTAAALLGLALGCLALGPALGWGFVLVQDMVFVPDPAFSRFTFGLAGGAPRVVPSDAVVTALSSVLPGELVQKAILLGVFVLGCSGAARLVPAPGLAPRLVAGAFYVWNPYVAERLLMGQWALLLGYAGLPWVVAAACSGRGPGRTALAMLPAAVGGFAAMTVTGLAALPVAVARSRASAVRVAALLVVFSLPWLVPALLRPRTVTGDLVGVEAFAARADTPFGAVGSLLSLGGIWNAHAVPAGYETLAGAVARLVLAVAGIAGFTCLAGFRCSGRSGKAGRAETARPVGPAGSSGVMAGSSGEMAGSSGAAGDGRVPYRVGLAVAAVAGFGIACAGVSEPGRAALARLIGVWGGFAVFRDAQQFVAPLALLVAVGLGLLTAAAQSATRSATQSATQSATRSAAQQAALSAAQPAARPVGDARQGRVRWAGAMALVPLAVLPTLAWGAAGALEAVRYPRDWTAAREAIRRDGEPGDILVLPFESYRRFPWNGGRAVLDPAQRFFAVPGRDVVANDTVRVGTLVVPSEDERARTVERVLETSSTALSAQGFRYVVVNAGTPAELSSIAARLNAARMIINGPDLRLYRFDGPVAEGMSVFGY
ncbi:hypothetical protein FHU36_007411 [Nonomuraea muscovyensis]|uniref:Uncharacterized protein n=1 Tax=Nonomuraea muscovyensis TaxID=1124761 RepID=A0A7X0F2A1_9ACTN|nr:hypothetical protein [Nonomuraea muscovyensis]MBB6350839.1 hypothetical protein [Nonomuraea muscovyensis]